MRAVQITTAVLGGWCTISIAAALGYHGAKTLVVRAARRQRAIEAASDARIMGPLQIALARPGTVWP